MPVLWWAAFIILTDAALCPGWLCPTSHESGLKVPMVEDLCHLRNAWTNISQMVGNQRKKSFFEFELIVVGEQEYSGFDAMEIAKVTNPGRL